MAAPLASPKKTVDMAGSRVRVSRIRRDPPPKPVKLLSAHELRARDQRRMILGICGVALSLFVVLIGINNWGIDRVRDWSIDYREPARK